MHINGDFWIKQILLNVKNNQYAWKMELVKNKHKLMLGNWK